MRVARSVAYQPDIGTAVRTGERSEPDVRASCVERQDPTMRMSMRRFPRLTKGVFKEARQPHGGGGDLLPALTTLAGCIRPGSRLRWPQESAST